MNFREHLKSRGLNINSYAKLVGSSASHLYGIDSGEKVPSYELAFRIEVETQGAIPMTYWGSALGWNDSLRDELESLKK